MANSENKPGQPDIFEQLGLDNFWVNLEILLTGRVVDPLPYGVDVSSRSRKRVHQVRGASGWQNIYYEEDAPAISWEENSVCGVDLLPPHIIIRSPVGKRSSRRRANRL